MKLKKYKILVCVLSMGLVFTPNAVLAAGTGADEVNLEEDMDGYWEAEEDAEDDFWEDEDWDDEEWEDEDWDDEEWEDEDWDDEEWEDEDWDDEEWEDEDWDTEDAFWDDVENVLPVMECCDSAAGKAAEAGENKPEGAEDSKVEESTESAEVTETQEEKGMPYIAGAQGGNSYKVDDAESRDDAIAGIYTPIRKTQLHASAGAEETAFLEIDENTKIHCYGYYTEENGAKWYYVQYFQNGRSFIGFCSSEELK